MEFSKSEGISRSLITKQGGSALRFALMEPSPVSLRPLSKDSRIGNLEKELLRKEVIQPHLPVRLPCYDFTPITDPTFDGSLHYWLGHRLRVLPTFVV